MKEFQRENVTNKMPLVSNSGEKLTENNKSNIEYADIEFERLNYSLLRLETEIDKLEGKEYPIEGSGEKLKYSEPPLAEFLYKLQFRISGIRENIDAQIIKLQEILYKQL